MDWFGTRALRKAVPDSLRAPEPFLCPDCGDSELAPFLAAARRYPQRTQTPVCAGECRSDRGVLGALHAGLASCSPADHEGASRGPIIMRGHNLSDADSPGVDTVMCNPKTAITGSYHHFDLAKHPSPYSAETRYRAVRPFDPFSTVGHIASSWVRTALRTQRLLAARQNLSHHPGRHLQALGHHRGAGLRNGTLLAARSTRVPRDSLDTSPTANKRLPNQNHNEVLGLDLP